MKKTLISVISLVAICILLMSSSNGISNRTGSPGETTCATSGCHNSFALNTGGGSVVINDNIPASGYVPGQTYSINVTVTKTLTPLFGFDFEALTSSNTTAGFITVTNSLQTYTLTGSGRQNITHKTNGGFTSNTKTFSFNWTAPATSVGNITFYAAGMASNKNGNTTGDYIYSANKVISPSPLITGTITGSPFCEGSTGINIPYTALGSFAAGNVFTAELSDAVGSFSSATVIGSVTSTASGTISSSVPLPPVQGSGYRIRVMASSPTTTGTTNNSNLTINLQPDISNAGSNQSICATSATLSANTPTSGTGAWSLLSGSGTLTAPANASTAVSNLAAGYNGFQWTISNPGCSSSTSTVGIYTATSPTPANASFNQTVCTNYVTLNGNVPSSGSGAWSLVTGSGTITAPTNASSTATNLGAGLNSFVWTIANSPCNASSDTVDITFTGTITIPDAGQDFTICATTYTLAANTPTAGTGMWTIVSGTGSIVTPTNPSSVINSLGNGPTVLRWTISNGACTPLFDDVTITSVAVSAANAGASQSVCASSTTLAANNPQFGTGSWSVAAGGASIASPTQANTTINGLTPGINTFVWTIANAPCSSSSATVTVNQTGTITVSSAGPDQSICSPSTTLSGNAPVFGIGSWTLISGAGTIASPSSPTTAVNGLGVGNNIFRWIITTGGCTPSIDDVTIASSSITPAVAGSNQTICSSTISLAANTPLFGTGTWSLVSGTASINAVTSPTTLVSGLANGFTIFRWTISNAPCVASVSDVTVTNCPLAILATGPLQGSPFCSTTSYNVMVSFSTTANFTGFYTAELSDSVGNFATPVAIGSGPSSPVSAVIPAGTLPGSGYRIRVNNSNPSLAGGDNGSDIAINTCNQVSIAIDSIGGSPFCATTSYNVMVPFITAGTFTGAFVAELSDPSGNFSAPLTIGYAYASPIAATIPSGTPPGSNYKIRVKNSNGLTYSNPNISNLSVNTCVIGFSEYELTSGFAVYPNPNSGEFYIEFKKEMDNVSVELWNVLGQLVAKKELEEIKAGSQVPVNINEITGSIYILKIKSAQGEIIKRISRY